MNIDEKRFTAESYGERLKQERNRLGFTQGELAEIGGVRRTTVYMYERGTRRPSLDFICALLPAGLSLSYILLGERYVVDASERVVDTDLAGDLHTLVDRYGVDSKGRLLQTEYRNVLFRQLLEMATNLKRDEVDMKAVQKVLKDFGK